MLAHLAYDFTCVRIARINELRFEKSESSSTLSNDATQQKKKKQSYTQCLQLTVLKQTRPKGLHSADNKDDIGQKKR